MSNRRTIHSGINIPAPGADTDILDADFGIATNETGAAKVVVTAQIIDDTVINLIARRKTGPTKSTGEIITVTGALLVDTDNFTLDDGANPAVNFEFDDDAAITGDVAIAIDGNETAEQIAYKVAEAINDAADLEISAAVKADGTGVDLTHEIGGTDGNQTVLEAVTDAGFTVAGMTGGLDDGETVHPLNGDVALVEGVPVEMEMPIHSDYEYNLQLDVDSDIESILVVVVKE